MNNWQPLTIFDKKMKIEDELRELENKRTPLVDRKKEIELELSEINNKIRVGGYLDQNEYAKICERQDFVKREKYKIEQQILGIKRMIREKNGEKDKITLQGKKIGNSEIKSSLIELRDKYMAFAADTTRVSSMRAMSSKFVEEIQAILKTLD